MAYKRSYGGSAKSTQQQDKPPETIINLDAKKRVTVRKFNNVNLVDIREFYTDANGDQKPGKKGISLTEDTYYKLIDAHNRIQHALDGLNGGAASKKAKIEKSGREESEPVKKEKKDVRKEKGNDADEKGKEKLEQRRVAAISGEEKDAGDSVAIAVEVDDNDNADGDFVAGDDEGEKKDDREEEEEEVSEADD